MLIELLLELEYIRDHDELPVMKKHLKAIISKYRKRYQEGDQDQFVKLQDDLEAAKQEIVELQQDLHFAKYRTT